MELKRVFISEIKPAEYNPRKWLGPEDPEYQRIKSSIETFGYVDPIILNSDYTVIGGHQRLTVLRDMGETQIEAIVIDLPKNQEKALNIALNKITGEWDVEKLSDLLEELSDDEEIDILVTGFSETEINGLLADMPDIDAFLQDEEKEVKGPKVIICPECGAEFEV